MWITAPDHLGSHGWAMAILHSLMFFGLLIQPIVFLIYIVHLRALELQKRQAFSPPYTYRKIIIDVHMTQ